MPDLPCYSIAGVTSPAGGQFVPDAVPLGQPVVTAAVPGYSADDPSGFDGDPHLYWKWTAPATGEVIFDGSLSYDTATGDPVGVNVSLFTSNVGPDPAAPFDLTQIGSPGLTRAVTVTAGVTYWIAVWNFGTLGDTGFILRISDYGAITDWTQPADQSWVISQDGAFHEPSVIPTGSIGVPLPDGTGYAGTYGISQSFAGPNPYDSSQVSATQGCEWDHASRAEVGSQWWSPDPTNPDVDIRAAWNGGPGVCVEPTGALFTVGDGSGAVGPTYETHAPVLGGPSSSRTSTYGITSRFWLTVSLDSLGPTGGLDPPTAPPGATVEYEATRPDLLALDAAPDQTVHLEGVGVTTQWFGRATPVVENPGDDWGPQNEYAAPGDGFASGRFIGGGSGPGGFPAEQDFQLPDFPPGVTSGDAPDWTTIDTPVVDAALAAEAAWQTQWDSGIDLPFISNYHGGLRFVGLFPEVFLSGYFAGIPGLIDIDERRHGQFVALRLHVRPPRYRIREEPTLPAVDLCAIPLRLYPRDDDLAAAPVARNYPPAKGDLPRNYSGYPG